MWFLDHELKFTVIYNRGIFSVWPVHVHLGAHDYVYVIYKYLYLFYVNHLFIVTDDVSFPHIKRFYVKPCICPGYYPQQESRADKYVDHNNDI